MWVYEMVRAKVQVFVLNVFGRFKKMKFCADTSVKGQLHTVLGSTALEPHSGPYSTISVEPTWQVPS